MLLKGKYVPVLVAFMIFVLSPFKIKMIIIGFWISETGRGIK
jgi:hypothetical protein